MLLWNHTMLYILPHLDHIFEITYVAPLPDVNPLKVPTLLSKTQHHSWHRGGLQVIDVS